MAQTAVKRPGFRFASIPGTVRALVGLATTAGVIHLVAAIEHVAEDQLLGAFFALVGACQLYAARRIYVQPDDHRMLKAVAAGSVAVALIWIVSRTSGMPVGPESGRVSKVGVADTIATAQELVLAAIVVAIVWRPAPGNRRLAWLNGGMGTRLTSAMLSAMLFIAAIGGHEH